MVSVAWTHIKTTEKSEQKCENKAKEEDADEVLGSGLKLIELDLNSDSDYKEAEKERDLSNKVKPSCG